MLTIRQAQFEAMDDDFRLRFHRKLMAILRADLPSQTSSFDDRVMLSRIARADRQAQTYGIIQERGIGQFVALTFLSGPDFDERPKTHRYLTNQAIEPHHRIETLFDEVVDQLRSPKGG